MSRDGAGDPNKPNGLEPTSATSGTTPPSRMLTPQAERALAEAEERRRAARDAAATDRPRELHGRGGAEPVRFGDWEIKGLAVDF